MVPFSRENRVLLLTTATVFAAIPVAAVTGLGDVGAVAGVALFYGVGIALPQAYLALTDGADGITPRTRLRLAAGALIVGALAVASTAPPGERTALEPLALSVFVIWFVAESYEGYRTSRGQGST